MKILLTGALLPMHWEMVGRFERDGHRVTLLGDQLSEQPPHIKATLHAISPNDAAARRVVRAARFDAIVFFYAYSAVAIDETDAARGSLLDALFNLQMCAEETKVGQFFLVTDARVFDAAQRALPYETAIPHTSDGVIIKAAEDCLRFSDDNDMRVMLVRVSNLYGTQGRENFFARVKAQVEQGQVLSLEGRHDTPCDFLHVDDLAQFINIVLGAHKTDTVHLCYSEKRTLADVEDMVLSAYPGASVDYSGECRHQTMVHADLSVSDEQKLWAPRHDWLEEGRQILTAKSARAGGSLKGWLAKPLERIKKARATPWIEIVVMSLVASYLTEMTRVYALFRFVDFWLFFVILIGSIHGTFFGIVGALAACVYYVVDWVSAGNELYLLLINVDNWLPPVMYFISGGMFGYVNQSLRMRIEVLQKERAENMEETDFIQRVYQQTYEDRNRLQEQVMRSRDSYGRIYNIACELDTLQPEQVFLSTLNVLEDIMMNHSVALYNCSTRSSFLRLVVQSKAYAQKLDKSLDIDKLPLLKERLTTGEVFMNTSLEANYPVLAAPVMQDGAAVALVVIWELPFEQQTLYYRNLFNMVVGLVQSSMIRALTYFGNSADIYLDGTEVLSDAAFRKSLSVYQTMRKRKAADFLFLEARAADDVGLGQMAERLGRAVRTTDLVGRLNNGKYYVLLAQASMKNLPLIEDRFRANGLTITIVPLEAIDG